MNLDQNELFNDSLVKDPEVHQSARGKEELFLSLQNGILSLKADGTWEWSERPDTVEEKVVRRIRDKLSHPESLPEIEL